MKTRRPPIYLLVLAIAALLAMTRCGDETPDDQTDPNLDRRLYVANSGANTISVIDTLTNAVTETITIDAAARIIRTHPFRSSLYLVQPSRNLVAKMLQMDSSVLARIPTPSNPFSLVFSNSETAALAYVSVEGSNRIDVLRLAEDRVLTSVTVGSGPTELAVDLSVGAPGRLFVVNHSAGSVSVVNLSTFNLVQNIQLGGDLRGIAFSGTAIATSVAYVADAATGVIHAIKLQDLTVDTTRSITAGVQPHGLLMRRNSPLLLVTNSGDGTLLAIDTTAPTTRSVIPTGPGPTEVVANVVGTRVYVANTAGNSVTVVNLDTSQAIATIPVGAAPRGMALH